MWNYETVLNICPALIMGMVLFFIGVILYSLLKDWFTKKPPIL